MSDIRFVRNRPGVRIYLHPADLVDMVTQPEVLASFGSDEIRKIIESLSMEENLRENQRTEHHD
jgi:hypothetical protein